MSFLKTIETKGNDQERYSWKKKFLTELYDRGLNRDAIFSLYQFIDILMNLSEELEKVLFDDIVKIEEKRKMPIITSAEKIGIKKGIEKGRVEGRLEEFYKSIYDILEIKFGEAILSPYERIKQIKNIDTLQKIRLGAIKAQTIEEVNILILPFL